MHVLEWYRVDASRPIERVLATAASLMAAGSLVIGVSFLTGQPEAVRIAATALGLVVIVSGPLVAFFGLRPSLTDDLYLALRVDGVLLHFEEPEAVVAWDLIERVRHEPETRAIVLTLRSGESLAFSRPFAGITAEALARRLDDCRRKAGFNLLR